MPDVPNLGLSEYLVASKPAGDLEYQDILITGMKREEKSNRLYTKLSQDYKDPDIKKLFQKLAAEEAKHKLFFESTYDEDILKDN